MHKMILLLSSIYALTGCATLGQETDLYESYKAYKDSVSISNVKERAPDYLTSRMLNNMNLGHPLITGEFIVFDRYFERESNHSQAIKGDIGCLSVNGFNDKEEPTTLNIEYHYSGSWRIDYVHVALRESSTEFQNEINCPLERF